MRRVPEHEQRRHKITVNLTDQEYDALIERATASQLAPSVVARTVFSEGLARMRGKRRASASDSVPTPVREQQQKPRQPEHDALCLPYLREASGPTDAIRRLEADGIPSPSGRSQWRKEAVWRICKRHGISYLYPTG